MGRRPRAAAQAAAASLRTPNVQAVDQSDEEMADAPASVPSTPQDDGTPVRNSEPPSEPTTPAPASQSVRGKRRLGRPPKNKPADWDAADDTPQNDGGSDTGTPVKRRRGRPPTGGGRWGKPRGGPSHVTQVPIDKEGNMMDVIDDEVALPEDPEGEEKVDKKGHLLGGREYRCRTFTIMDKDERLYMLSTEPARCIGFRDSYLFFQKHKQLFKIIVEETAKRDLIERDVIPHSYKGRAIGVVTARSVFREFGARIVVGGRKVIDDYQVQAARAKGEVEGELADPEDKLPRPGEPYNKNQYVAWHGASSVYHSGAPSVPMPNGKAAESKKRRVVVTGDNWMLEHAREASRFNAALASARRQNIDGVYDPHTNLLQFPKITQATHAHWERLPNPTPAVARLTNGAANRRSSGQALTNGLGAHDIDVHIQDPPESPDTHFSKLGPLMTQNYVIVDTHMQAPPRSGMGIPGPDGGVFDIGVNGLNSVSEDVLAELPPDCRSAFDEARQDEKEWQRRWGAEVDDGARGKLKVGFGL